MVGAIHGWYNRPQESGKIILCYLSAAVFFNLKLIKKNHATSRSFSEGSRLLGKMLSYSVVVSENPFRSLHFQVFFVFFMLVKAL